MEERDDRPKSDWQKVKSFKAEVGKTTIVVEVKRDFSVPWPKLSMCLCRPAGDRMSNNFSFQSTRDGGDRTFTLLADEIARLWRAAEEWAQEQVEANDREFATRKKWRGSPLPEQRRGPPPVMRKGKTSRDRHKRRGGGEE